MSGMGQLNTLWEDDMKGGLPVLFNIFNNQYGMGGQTSGETMGYDILARMGAGFNPNQMHAERVDGFNPLAVIDGLPPQEEDPRREQAARCSSTSSPTASPATRPSDSSSYRTKEEIAAWEAQDPIIEYRKQLIEAGLATAGRLATTSIKTVDDAIFRIPSSWPSTTRSPRAWTCTKNPDEIADMMFTNGHVDGLLSDAKPDVNMPMEENPRVQAIATQGALRASTRTASPFSKIQGLPAARRPVRGHHRPLLQGRFPHRLR